MPKKPYWDIPIVECGEPLVSIPSSILCANPHPYAALGAPYGSRSPFCLRQTVVTALLQAQALLQTLQPQWQIFVFDAYRPIAVQQFMVDYTFSTALEARGLVDPDASTLATLWEEVYQLWALPTSDPATPPPHSTGAALDITVFDRETQSEVCMGSPIDELSERSHPDYFGKLASQANLTEAEHAAATQAHTYRQRLAQCMIQAGFQRHPGEWWHFSLGDQLWAWLGQQQAPHQPWVARYGRVEP
ncbi:MAG TPA: M15 family metallopeptidase [Stenomitos sp.]